MKPILEIQDISKKYTIGRNREPYLSLRENWRTLFKSENGEEFRALNHVSFEVMPGESLGIIGKNGAGKSTLLKILSKITPPSSGRIINRGRIASLLEVGTGFHGELTGRENVYLNGSILGLKRKEITRHLDSIISFSGVGDFMDTPLKRFSSGMQLRLAFAVAAHLEPEILIIDEVLAVGDAEFQKKCLGKMNEVSKSGRTVLFVSHDMNAVSALCSRCIILSKGTLAFNGSTGEAISNYLKNEVRKNFYRSEKEQDRSISIREIHVTDQLKQSKTVFLYQENICLNFRLGIKSLSEKVFLFVTVLDEMKRPVCSFETDTIREEVTLRIQHTFLTKGTYSLHVFMNQPRVARWDELYDICFFEILDNGSPMQKHGDYKYGSVFGYGEWF